LQAPTERLLSGFDFADFDDDPSPPEDLNHGMCCAGIIAASHETDSVMGTFSNSGILSINPIVKIVPIKVFCNDYWFEEITTDHLVMAIRWAYQESGGNADVLSNSWNYRELNEPEKPTINEALYNATQYGRPIYQQGIPIGFRGCPVIFSAGNSGTSQLKYPARLPYCFAVGAIDSSEARYDYSCYGPDLDLVTYSSDNSWEGNFWSLDQMGALGRNRGDKSFLEDMYDCGPDGNNTNYDCLFGGTSAACPVVAGTASLLIAKDSTLTSSEIYDILKKSAVTELGGQQIDTPSTEFGYGRVDAFRAILAISRGDVNNDGDFGIDDITFLITYLYENGPAPFPSKNLADCTCDGIVDISDITRIIGDLYLNGPDIVNPCYNFDDPQGAP